MTRYMHMNSNIYNITYGLLKSKRSLAERITQRVALVLRRLAILKRRSKH